MSSRRLWRTTILTEWVKNRPLADFFDGWD